MRPDLPHQTRAIEDYSRLVANGARRVLFQLPTGGGKTHFGLRCAEMMVRRGGRVLWCAHRDELVSQPKLRILAEGWPVDNIAVLQAGRWSGSRDGALVIASIQSLLAMPGDALRKLLSTIDLFVLDEARHYAAAQWRTVASAAKPGAYFLGLDATPVRVDGKPLGDLFDHLLVGATVAELTAAGSLVPSVILAPSAYQDELAQDAADAYCARTPGKRAIVFCSSVADAHRVAARIRRSGYLAEALDAKTSDAVREGALRRFMAGETQVLCNVRILTEGTDLPPCEVIVHAARCASLSDWIQKGGRGLRPSPGTRKERCTILDLHGCFHEYGFLDDPHVYTLAGRGVSLADALPPIGQCPKCYAWGRSSAVCAQCGYQLPAFAPPPPRVKAADLIEVRRADSEDTRRERLDRMALEEVRAGRSPYRAMHRWKGTYGEAPPREWMTSAVAAAERAIADEKRASDADASPLFARIGVDR